jgi:hypothetical protein
MPLVSRRASPSDAPIKGQPLTVRKPGSRSLVDIPPHADDVRSTPQKKRTWIAMNKCPAFFGIGMLAIPKSSVT